MEQRGTVVVTGATGLIGRPLTRRLIEDGYAVVVFSRDPARAILYNHQMIPRKMLDLGYTLTFPRLQEAVRDIIAQRHSQS